MLKCPLCHSEGKREDWPPGTGVKCISTQCGFACWEEQWERLPRVRFITLKRRSDVDSTLAGFMLHQELFKNLKEKE